jgi:hypothetical protein
MIARFARILKIFPSHEEWWRENSNNELTEWIWKKMSSTKKSIAYSLSTDISKK